MESMKKSRSIREIYDQSIGKIIPAYAFLSVIFCFVFNSLIYSGTQWLMKDAKHLDLSSDFDRRVPFRPEWVWIYVICFLFWGINYIMITRLGKEEWFRFAVGDYLSRIICGIFFVLLPTTNIRPEVTGDGITAWMMQFIYRMDPAFNLFPSIHCLVSWFCFIGLRGRKEIPGWYRCFSCIFAVLVFASTQFTKQHYFIDIIAGVAIAEICYYIGHHTDRYQKVMACFERLNNVVFGKEWEEEVCRSRE